jgi:hypothetical protein
MNDQNSHCSTGSTNVDLASDRVDRNMDYFDVEVLTSLVKSGMGRGGNDPTCVLISVRSLRRTKGNKFGYLTSQAQ